MANPERLDEEVAAELLELLHGDESSPPADLPDKTMRKVRASITSRDLLDLTTFVFIARFCAPLIDLIAAIFGDVNSNRRDNDE